MTSPYQHYRTEALALAAAQRELAADLAAPNDPHSTGAWYVLRDERDGHYEARPVYAVGSAPCYSVRQIVR